MKLNKTLIVISWITLLPIILLIVSSLITNQILVPSGICHPYDGSDFGASPICNTFPLFSFFGFILLLFGGMGSAKFIGILTSFIYFVRVFLHNRKQTEEKWKYSIFMMVLVCVLVILQLLSFSTASHNPDSPVEKLRTKIETPTETLFVCDSVSALELNNSSVNIITVDGDHAGVTLIGHIDDTAGTFTWYSSSKMQEYKDKLETCKNINQQSISELYTVNEAPKSNSPEKGNTLSIPSASLWVEGIEVVRSDVENTTGKLMWVFYNETGKKVLSRSAEKEYRINPPIKWKTVNLEMYFDGSYHVISNTITNPNF